MTKLTEIKYLTIHCSATPEGRNDGAEKIKQWDIQSFGQPSYHWIIELDGKMVRHLEDQQRGAHVRNRNTGNIGICYIGGVDKTFKPKDTRTAAQKEALAKLIKDYIKRYPNIKILGHRDWPLVAKACPSFDVQRWLDTDNILFK